MSFANTVLTALFCITVVFSVLAMLWAVIRIFSWIIRLLEHTQHSKSNTGH